jgi:hypothetical protein
LFIVFPTEGLSCGISPSLSENYWPISRKGDACHIRIFHLSLAHIRDVVMALEADTVFKNFRKELSVQIPTLRLVMVNCYVETSNEIKKGLFSRIALPSSASA